jgi:hypothetical protein
VTAGIGPPIGRTEEAQPGRALESVQDERRTFERVGAGFPALLVGSDKTGGWRHVSAVVVDISVGGMRLCADEAFVSDESIQVTFQIPDDNGPIETTLEVLACEPAGAGEFTIRSKFTNLNGETILRLARWTLAESKRVTH